MRHILFFVLTAAFLACKNETYVPPTLNQDEIIPLATRNSWEFVREWIDTNGVPIDSTSLSMQVSQPDTFGTELAFPVSNFPIVFVNPSPLLCANKAGGLYNVIPGPNPLSPAFVKLLPFPSTIGDSIVFSGHTIRTTSVNERVVVPAGSFICVRYDIMQYNSLRGRLFVAPKVGIVKAWQRYYAMSAVIDELLSFQIH